MYEDPGLYSWIELNLMNITNQTEDNTTNDQKNWDYYMNMGVILMLALSLILY